MELRPSSDDALPGVPHAAVQLSSWTPRWHTLFKEEAERLGDALGPLALGIEHYGSTSVPGLIAKPILDILVGGPAPLKPEPYVAALAPLGYEFAHGAGVPEHLVFGRGRARTHLVHVVEHGGSAWDRALRFRDLLRVDSTLAAAYADLKSALARRHPADRASYTAAKGAFIERSLAADAGGTMTQFAWPEQVATLGAMLDALENRVARGDRDTSGLTEFKSALDDMRLRTWSLLSASNADDPHAFQERFRTHRGTEMCRALAADLQTGKLSSRPPDLPALGEAARDLAAAVKEATRKPRKRRGKGDV